ncbi:glutathione S-transferase family protein [Massilia sp. P8910]|uniref:glutathione S-transferase family protein n=1 Tax=Massilia antarctica TaxID=2765360 RepID=UPI0006BB6C00|nr:MULTISPECIES: glutathione S-transferase family protein [Massilia]MCE3603713.1 glutathione S-transferase family protein [Massilia antarctica]MCY0912545.1 glutathione S-transferase family protein [Massilia sp. H27-R4]CUI03599.1 Glutathione S-transferase [Janthinobacterium sp. CG23_2]CUU27385.1 Glutathione S-transferase [Janthinobacterium sp. CG23_2]
MKLYISNFAPNPRRVTMFIAEKGITGIEPVMIDLATNEHKSERFLAKNPLARVPALELDDGRVLTETRAICTYLEGLHPEPNLMGEGFEERAFIEMADRRVELYLMLGIANCVRHTHPGLAALEQPQFPEFGASQGEKMREHARWLDRELATRPFMAGERFTVADITAWCALEFARGLMKFKPGAEGMDNLQAWRDRIAERPSAAR